MRHSEKDVPVITNASVRNTDAENGSMYVAWSKPSAFDLDTLQNPGPYEYRVFHSIGNSGANLTQINSYTAPTFTSFIDTTFIDTLINTVANPYSYKIEFYSNGNKIGETEIASSIYVTAIGQDNKVLYHGMKMFHGQIRFTPFTKSNSSHLFTIHWELLRVKLILM